MQNKEKNIVVIGAGSFGTAVANALTLNSRNNVTIITRTRKQAEEINENHTNSQYFPNRKLHHFCATIDFEIIAKADVIFLAIPSGLFSDIIYKLKPFLHKESVVVNLSKGFGNNGKTIVEDLKNDLSHQLVVTLKGPTFASELMTGIPSIFTLGFNVKREAQLVKEIFSGTNVFLDFTTDIMGVEILSAIKNVYAIAIGFVDAKYNSANTRFMVLTKAFNEMRLILPEMGGSQSTLELSCGIGDLGLTSLNDLSRNRTLGLLLGKGFYTQGLKDGNSVVVEGVRGLVHVEKNLSEVTLSRLPLFNEVKLILQNPGYKLNIRFEKLINQQSNTVITYGTFDLLHYGHLEILKRAKSFGTKLIVGLSSDEFNKLKGKKSVHSFKKRKEFLESVDFVDLVIEESSWGQKAEDVQKYDADLFIMGDDWEGKFDFLKEYCKVLYLPRTEGISSTKIKGLLNEGK
jgi:glycerol-3-phosphate dehydrogenase (NAD(P)+)